jgi:hypothetical protein
MGSGAEILSFRATEGATVPRKPEKATFLQQATDWVMAAGALVLVGGLVSAFLVVGIWGLHKSLSRNQDENLVARHDPPKPPPAPSGASLEELKKPLPAPDPTAIAAVPPDAPVTAPVKPAPPAPAPPPAPKRIPEGPPSRDATRMDAEGFLRYWLLLGPIPAEKPLQGSAEIQNAPMANEAQLRPRADERVSVRGRDYHWRRYKSPEFLLDFKKAFEGQPGDDSVAYAAVYLNCEEELRDLRLLVGSNDQCKVWVNGAPVLQHLQSRTLERDGSVVAGIHLKKGQNLVVLKVANEKNLWQGCLRFMDRNGTPIRHLQVTSTPQ